MRSIDSRGWVRYAAQLWIFLLEIRISHDKTFHVSPVYDDTDDKGQAVMTGDDGAILFSLASEYKIKD
jgi:hypothetical protein